MEAIYDKIGADYTIGRSTDPNIASFIHQFLADSRLILNIGAGTGSYEPADKILVAVEPSIQMINQRPKHSSPVTQGCAERLPFKDASFTHSMTVLSMHHWTNREAAYEEIKRVTTKRFIAVTWNPNSPPYWLTKAYFPEIHEHDQAIFPPISELETSFPGIKIYPLAIPADCTDGFTAAYWARPHAYLDSKVRSSMSTFGKLKNLETGLSKLKADLASGEWSKRHNHIKALKELDAGYIVAVWDAQQPSP